MEIWKKFGRERENGYQLARRRTYLEIDLDVLTNNIRVLRRLCSQNTEIIAVLKANAYGHGSVELAKHLRDIGVHHFAVASPVEGIELRKAGIESYIQIFGNACEEEIPDLIDYDLVPTVGTVDFLQEWAMCTQNSCPDYISMAEDQVYLSLNTRMPTLWLRDQHGSSLMRIHTVRLNVFVPRGFDMNGRWIVSFQTWPEGYHGNQRSIVLKVDTGMSRNGFQPEQLDDVVNYCDEKGLLVHSIMTHFASAWDNPTFTTTQLETFLKVAAKYRLRGIKLHAANSAGTLLGYGTDLDFVRPGIAMYGLPPDTTEYAINMYTRLGLQPVLSWMAKPNLVKNMTEGRTVGYDNTYRCKEGEVIATLPIGYADGYNRLLSGNGVVTTDNGNECPVIGRVSMDAISVRLPTGENKGCNLCIIKSDYSSPNSVVELAKQLRTITYDVTTGLAARLSRVYTCNGLVYLTKT